MAIDVFVDANVLVFALGGTHVHRSSCRALLRAAESGRVRLHGSVEAIQECSFHRLRRTQRERALAETGALRRLVRVHAFDEAVLDRALGLLAMTPIRGRDAVHAATALNAGFDHIVTTEADFAVVPGLRVVTPAEALTG